MSAFYDEMRALAVELIDEFGSGLSATFYRPTSTGFDPLTGEETLDETEHEVIAVVLPSDDRSREEARALGWDLKFMTPVIAGGFIPQPGDQVTLPGRSGRFTIIAPVEAIQPDGELIALTVRARRG